MTDIAQKPHQWLSWIASIALVTSAILAAFNLYPYYAYGFMASNALWILVGVVWKEKTIIFMNVFLTVIYIAGLWFK